MLTKLRSKLTYPHVMSTLAVFLAIGGGTFAVAALKKNSVGPKQIEKNAVRASEIKANAARASEVATDAVGNSELGDNSVGGAEAIDNSLTGADVDEGSLGEVPLAASADAREILQVPLTRVAPSASGADDAVARGGASRIALASSGPLSVYGKCFVNTATPGNPGVRAEVYIDTTSPGTVFDGADNDSSNGFISSGTPESDRILHGQSSFAGVGDPGTLNSIDSDDIEFWAAADNTALAGHVFVATKVGTPEVGDGVFGPGDACLFGGYVQAG
jgi:hypothetical protein